MTLPRTCVLLALICWHPGSLIAAGLKTVPPGDVSAEQQKLLDELATSPDYFMAAMRLKDRANQGVLRKLEELADSSDKTVRTRAGFALVQIPCKESIARCVRLAVEDKDAGVREGVANALLSGDNPKLVKEAGLLEECKKGLEDKKVEVQLAFAVILQENADASGLEVLKTKGLEHKDHHWQETAAEALAELGDDSGAKILIKMLGYTDKNHPYLRANREMRSDADAWKNLLATVNAERVRVCGHLGRLKCAKALRVLEKQAKSSNEDVAKAAQAAIAAIGETEKN